MSSFLNATQKLRHVTAVPESANKESAVAMLRDHEHFLQCSPHNTKRERVAAPPGPATVAAALPAGIDALGETEYFRVTDVLHALPAGLWDSDIVSTYEFTNVVDGVFVRIRSPMGVLLESLWTIADGTGEVAGPGRLVMVEDCTVKCSRLLVGVVKSASETNWKGIHERMVAGIKV